MGADSGHHEHRKPHRSQGVIVDCAQIAFHRSTGSRPRPLLRPLVNRMRYSLLLLTDLSRVMTWV
jgi:hypothetical protein